MARGTLYPKSPCCPFLPLDKSNKGSGNVACEQALLAFLGGGGGGEEREERELILISQSFEYPHSKNQHKMLIGGD